MKAPRRVDQSGFAPSIRVEYWPNAQSTQYRVQTVPFRSAEDCDHTLVDRGFLNVALPELAGLGLSGTLAALGDSLQRERARVSSDGGGHPKGPHRWSQAALPGL